MNRKINSTNRLSSNFTRYFLAKTLQIGSLSSLMLLSFMFSIPVAIADEEPEEEITVTGKILNRPVTSTQRRDATLQDGTRPAYTINRQEIEQQGA
ncbi:MAG: TonB-dependent receptor, partial [Pseudanabaena sp. LacPavin_0818_WC45_MAG_42_6]|nr:TonB-dependent receptor [Pseudanabaena sp. LacPavin_0818_WC45_MAG_42_6]